MQVVCPYCQQPAKLVLGRVLFPHRQDLRRHKFWRCDPCDAHVGTHGKTDQPLGTLANAALRSARQSAHAVFDAIWQGTGPVRMTRRKAYKWLSKELGIPATETHIGQFNIDQCMATVAAVRQLWSRYSEFANPQTPAGDDPVTCSGEAAGEAGREAHWWHSYPRIRFRT